MLNGDVFQKTVPKKHCIVRVWRLFIVILYLQLPVYEIHQNKICTYFLYIVARNPSIFVVNMCWLDLNAYMTILYYWIPCSKDRPRSITVHKWDYNSIHFLAIVTFETDDKRFRGAKWFPLNLPIHTKHEFMLKYNYTLNNAATSLQVCWM